MLRVAQLQDVPELERLIRLSVEGLQSTTYTARQRELAMGKVYGTDRQMIADGTYFVIGEAGQLQACGGWSWRRTAFGGDGGMAKDDTPLDPATEAARIRAYFVHPACARCGLGTQLLLACEAAARRAGFARMEMTSTLAGLEFYRRHGYLQSEALELPLGDGLSLPVRRMEKRL